MLTVSADGLEATAVIPAGISPKAEELHRLLAESKIVFGLDVAAFREILLHSSETERHIVVAKGRAPKPGKDAWIESIHDDSTKLHVQKDGSVDYHEGHLVQEVKQDQVLLTLHPPEPGTDGMDVRGKVLPAPKPKVLDLASKAGEGTTISPDGLSLIALTPGLIINRKDGRLEVRRLLIIDGDVDFKIGNIETEYPVHIKGDIKAGFKVKSTGTIIVEGSIEDARVSAQGNLQVKGGILPGKERVKAHGDMSARFVWDRTLKARSIMVKTSILRSDVNALGFITADEINGGRAVAAEDITVKTLGAEAEVPTSVCTGVDPMRQALYDQAISERERLTRDFEAVKLRADSAAAHATDAGKRARRLSTQGVGGKLLHEAVASARESLETSNVVQAEKAKLETELSAVLKTIKEYEATPPVVTGRTIRASVAAWPGVTVSIGRFHHLKLTQKRTGVTFRIEDGNLIT